MKRGTLYVGVDPRHYKTDLPLVHLPLIEVVPRPFGTKEIREIFARVLNFTHIVFTSKSAVSIFCDYYRQSGYTTAQLKNMYIVAVGRVPAFFLKEEGITPTYMTGDEAQTGVVRVLSALDLEEVDILLPLSSSVRPQLAHFLVEHNVRHQVCTLYDVHPKRPGELPNLEEFEEVVFTTPSVVEEFFALFPVIPESLRLHPIGFYSREALRKALEKRKEESYVDAGL